MKKLILPCIQSNVIPMLRSPTVAELLRKVLTKLLVLPKQEQLIKARHFLKLTGKLAAAKIQKVLLIVYSRADLFLKDSGEKTEAFQDLVRRSKGDVHVADSRQHFPKEKSAALAPRTRFTSNLYQLVPAIFEIADAVDERLIILVRAGGRLNVFCATDTMLATFKSICVRTSEEIESDSPSLTDCRPLHIDVTFEATKPWVCLACFRHPMFVHIYTKAQPVVPAFFCLICSLQEEDYTYCSGQLKRHFNFNENIKTGLLIKIFGEERRRIAGGRYKIGGLVDSNSKAQFDLRLEALKEKWDCLASGFFDCFEENTGAKIRANYLLPTRLAAGRGHNRVTNNDQENLNRRMKEELEGPLKPPDQLIRIVEQFCQDAFERLELAVIGQGDYRLKEKYRHLQKTWEEWSEMSADQRAQYLDRHFHFKGATIVAPERKTLSVPLTANHLPGTSPAQLQALEDAAVALVTNSDRFYDLIDAIGTSVEAIRVVKWDDSGGYRFSSCEQFKTYRFVCAHTLAVAERNNTLIAHLSSITNQFENETAELLLKRRLQPGVGKKPSRRTGHPFTATLQGRTVAEIVQRPIASTSFNVDVTQVHGNVALALFTASYSYVEC
uniref:SWIM-type domain-containing protein n=1 Tax=Plectus sambesii TaxID=2011161 RepID=A0A914XEX8_9BILA